MTGSNPNPNPKLGKDPLRPHRSLPVLFPNLLLPALMRRPALIALLAMTTATVTAEDGVAFFESKVRPLLVKHCYECHSQESKVKGGLLLDRKEGWQQGGDAGPALVPGDPDRSLLIHSIRYEDEDLQMPPKSKLNEADIRILEQWVRMGAPDPRSASLASAPPNPRSTSKPRVRVGPSAPCKRRPSRP